MPRTKKDKTSRKNHSSSDERSRSKERSESLKIFKNPHYQRLINNYNQDFVELSAHHEYKENPWAYFYAYPEYFPQEPFPGPVSSNEMLFNDDKFFSAVTGPKGNIFIHFAPGVGSKYKPQSRDSNNQIIAESITDYVWFAGSNNPGEAFNLNELSGWDCRAVTKNARCVGGYMMIETPQSVAGLFKHREFLRSRQAPGYDLNEDIVNSDPQPLLPNTIFRFRTPKMSYLRHDVGNDYFAHEVLIYNLPPNTPISITVKRTIQAQMISPVAFLNYIKRLTMIEAKSAKKVSRDLIASIPNALQFRPLTDAMKYYDHLFSEKGIKRSLFPRKAQVENLMAPVNLPNIGNIKLNIHSHKANIHENFYDPNKDDDEHENKHAGFHHKNHGYVYDRGDSDRVRSHYDRERQTTDRSRFEEFLEEEIRHIPPSLRKHINSRYPKDSKKSDRKKE